MDIILLVLIIILLVMVTSLMFSLGKLKDRLSNDRPDDDYREAIGELAQAVSELKSDIKTELVKQDAVIQAMGREMSNILEMEDKRLNSLIARGLQSLGEQNTNNQKVMLSRIDDRFKNICDSLNNSNKVIYDRLIEMNRRIDGALTEQNEVMMKSFALQRSENREQIDKIRESVNEKLDKTLNEQFERSFKGIIEQMTQLQTSMGELKGISNQVGSLERTLNGVKTRGILGETQLKMLIADVLTSSQYDTEVPTIPGSDKRVEIAIKIPDKNSDGYFYLPVDSKFHVDRYNELTDAYDSGDKDRIADAKKQLRAVILKDAKDINDKYIKEPYTTPYGILFVPSESIYAEIVNLNIVEELNKLHITIAGPYTMMAILSTILNYWQALAIEKKSNEIEKTLSSTKKAVGAFDTLLTKVRNNVNTISNDLEKLQTTRTNVIMRALKNVSELATDATDQETGGIEDGEE